MSIWYGAGATKSWVSVLSMSCSWLVSVTFGQPPLHSLSRSLFRESKNRSTKCQSLRRTKVNHPSSNNLAVSSLSLIKLFSGLSIHLFISVYLSVHDTTPEGILSSCGCTFTRTLTTSIDIWDGAGATRGVTSSAAHRGIWHSADVTKSWLHSPRWSKSFAVIEKRLSSSDIFYLDDKRNAERWQSNTNERQKNLDERNGMLWLSVNVRSLNLSLFLAFPLHSNVDAARYCFVVQNRRIPPQNGNLLEELSSWTEKSFFPCRMTWFALQWSSFAETFGYFVCWSVYLCLSCTVQDPT